MQISGNIGAALPTGAANNSPNAANASLNGASNAAIDQQFADLMNNESANSSDDPATYLNSLTKKGITSYWGAQVDKIKAKVTAEVMAEHNATPDSVKAMAPDDRATLEAQIIKEVEQRVLEMVKNSMNGQSTAMNSNNPAMGAIAKPTTPPAQGNGQLIDMMV